MRVIIAGTRDLRDALPWVERAVEYLGWSLITEVVSGHSGNVDIAGETWAAGGGIPVKLYPADWTLGPKAGPLRNEQMAQYADALVAVLLGSSRGTLDMIARAQAHKLNVFVLRLPDLPYLHVDKRARP